jgi:hypothetical protein
MKNARWFSYYLAGSDFAIRPGCQTIARLLSSDSLEPTRF